METRIGGSTGAPTSTEKGFSRTMKRLAVMLVSGTVLATPGVALASGNSTNQQYGGNVQSVQGASASRTPDAVAASANTTQTAAAASSELPFTGLDVGVLAAGGVVLVGAGLAVRRASGHKNHS